MRFLAWLRRLLGLGPSTSPERAPTERRVPARRAAPHPEPAAIRTDLFAPKPALPAAEPAHDSLTDLAIQRGTGRVGHLDDEEKIAVVLEGADEDLLFSIERRIERGRFQLPQLPSTSVAAIELTNHPSADIVELSQMISADPLLCSELLKTANSAYYAAEVPAETLHDAIMRIGMRALRTMIFSVSMRGVILRGHGLNEYAEEVWRQALSLAGIARATAKELRTEPDKAFMLGLLQDIGKIALLTMLREEVNDRATVTPALVGRMFHRFHERAGAAMANAWRLPAEVGSVAGCHHDYKANQDFPQTAAMANLWHQLDLYLSLGDAERYRGLARSDIMDFLGVPAPARARILTLAKDAFDKAHAAHAAQAPAG
jgi:HD-like signal output (HDOD) protein